MRFYCAVATLGAVIVTLVTSVKWKCRKLFTFLGLIGARHAAFGRNASGYAANICSRFVLHVCVCVVVCRFIQ